jgi:hypothetical protein
MQFNEQINLVYGDELNIVSWKKEAVFFMDEVCGWQPKLNKNLPPYAYGFRKQLYMSLLY